MKIDYFNNIRLDYIIYRQNRLFQVIIYKLLPI